MGRIERFQIDWQRGSKPQCVLAVFSYQVTVLRVDEYRALTAVWVEPSYNDGKLGRFEGNLEHRLCVGTDGVMVQSPDAGLRELSLCELSQFLEIGGPVVDVRVVASDLACALERRVSHGSSDG